MTVVTTNVLVGLAQVYTAPSATAFPDDDDATWASPWTHIGATEEGVTFVFTQNTNDIRIEEQSTPVLVPVDTSDIQVQAALSEDTLETMKLAYGGGTIATVAPGVGQIGKKTLTLASSLTRLTLGLEGINPAGFYRRIQVPAILSVANVTSVYRRAANARRYGVSFRAVCPPEDIDIIDKTAVAT